MYNMFNSASKIVLLAIAFTVCAGVFFRILDSKDFMVLATMVFTFYYSKSDGVASDGNIQ